MSRNLVCVLFVSLGWYSCDGWAQSGLVLPDLASNLGATDVSTGGTVLAGGTSPLGEEPDKLIDDLVSTKWLAFEPSGTIVDVQLPSGPRIVNAYTVTSANDFPLRDPYDLAFSGSNDGVNFTQIEFFIDIEFESRFETQLFMSGNASSYEYYRFDFFTEFGALGDPDTMPNSIQVAEIELFENFVLDLPKLVVNRDTGDMTLENPSLAPLDLAGYSVTSPFGGITEENWSPVTGRLDGSGTGNGTVDSAPWSIESQTAFDLSESSTGTGGTLAGNSAIGIGNAWLPSPIEDVAAQWTASDGSTFSLFVEYQGNSGNEFASIDLNADGTVDVDDWLQYKSGSNSDFTVLTPIESYVLGDFDADGDQDLVDFRFFRGEFDAINGAGAFQAMIGNLPEPSGWLLIALAVILASMSRRCRTGLPVAIVMGFCLVLMSQSGIAGEVLPALVGFDLTDPEEDGIPNASAIAGGNSPIGEEPEMGIDNSTNTKWLTFEPNGTFYQVAFDGGAKHAVNTYTISSANDFPVRDPFSWTLSGSNDGVNFTVVDAQQSQGFANRFETQRFRVGNSQFYNSYRFDFQTALGAGAPDPGDPNSIQISEIELFDDPNAAILTLKLDATTGNAVLQNESPFAIELDSYRIFSVSGALDPSGWSTIQSQDLPGFPPGSGVGDGWEAGPNPNNFELIEWFLTDSSSLGASQSIDLGSAFSYNGNTDILFEFHNDLQGEVRGYVEYLNIPTGPVCDVTADQACDNDDIDVLYDEIAAGSNPAFVDFDGNGMVDVDDIDDWLTLAGIENGKVYLPGDTNLDGEVGGPDFTRLALNFGNVGSNPALAAAYWGDGNFNADAGIGIFEVGGVDFTALALNFGFASVASVPEPDSVSLAWLAITLWFARTSQRRTVLRLVALTPLCGRLE